MRRDLPAPQVAVQACHAAVEAARRFLPPGADHPHLVLCAVDSQRRLLAAADRLFLGGVRHALFREPDRGGEVTALATGPLPAGRRRLLEPYRCLTREDLLTAPAEEGPRGPSPGPSGVAR